MRLEKKALILFGLVLLGNLCFAQIKKSTVSSRFRAPIVSKSKARIMCPIFLPSQYPYQGIGIKMGDPLALTYKFYANKHWSFAADAGKAASGLYNKYYRSVYSTYLPDSLGRFESMNYLTHKAKADWLVETKFLYQWDASKLSKGIQLYAGLGWQWRSTILEYDYTFEDAELNNSGEGQFGKFTEKRFTYGPVVIGGFEYSYFSLPISAFIEIEWFNDVLLDPGYSRFQGGVGLRYVF